MILKVDCYEYWLDSYNFDINLMGYLMYNDGVLLDVTCCLEGMLEEYDPP